MTIHEFESFLNFLLMYQIIDTNEYNRLLLQALPYLQK